MPLPRAIAFVGALLIAGVARAADEFPYAAYVNADEVNVRSGPGDNYYPVMKLNRGDRVEVFRHDPGGWYAVRPPEGAYSWVLAEFIKPGENNLGVVSGERVVARVGSSFSDVRDVIQVRLDRGETVEILEAKRFNTGPGAQTWYKIAPPAGEFRWISGKFVEQRLSVAPRREPSARNNLLLAGLSREDRAIRAEEAAENEEALDTAWRSERRRERVASRERLEPLPPVDEDDESTLPAERVRRRRPVGLDQELEELDLELSAMVSQETAQWDFNQLHARAERAVSRAETAVQRGRARLLLAKVDRFDDIRRRYLATLDVRTQTQWRNQELASRSAAAGRRPYSGDARYDGTGKLAQVVSNKIGTPRYALLDQAGEVRFYITPAPGVSLRNYLGQEVGVTGTLGFLPEQQRQHVTARRIIPLSDSPLLR
ncbi:MAG TPA: SH3 domain-containing protein [Pirellulales bacterium]